MTSSYKILWISFLTSNVGDWLRKMALPILVYNRTGSAYHMASLYGISFVPWIFFSIFGGVLADRYNKKGVIAIGHFISLIFMGGLYLTFAQDNLNLMLVYILVFLISSVEPLVHPAFQSILPEIVQKKDIIKANAGIQMIDNTLNLVGPMLSGTIILFIQPENILLINAIAFAFAGFIVLFINENKVKEPAKEFHLMDNLKEGFRYVKTNKIVLNGSILFLFTNFGIHMFQSNFMFFMTDILDYSSVYIGTSVAISGVGALMGAFLAPVVNKHFQAGMIISVSTILAGLSTFMLFGATNYIYIGIIQGIINIFGNINVITYFSLRQEVVPQQLLGRVISVTRMISYLSIPVGAFVGGYFMNNGYSIYMIIILTGLIRTGAGLYGYFSPLGRSKWSKVEED